MSCTTELLQTSLIKSTPHHLHRNTRRIPRRMNPTDMATLTASLERSLRNCSLNDASGAFAARSSSNSADSGRRRRFLPSLIPPDSSSSSSTATLVELNSHISLPYHWEQCLDLKTGEIYYVNWRSGKKAKEDPRLNAISGGGYDYSDEEVDDGGSYDSEGSSAGGYSSSASSMENYRAVWKSQSYDRINYPDDVVLVVAGCKGCLMYHMVPKQVEDCPKCSGQLLHFDRSDA